ncbi:MAG TPA: threonine/serine exporter family protein [Candidatus Saccharibacteria bacterium]|nr:threonine/serine exporter family protein [Candidatus Saccharibacteria bacterium]HRQ07143.1 threonine/serine exporter family protein [Candidatus Saccharibacteria bacterium]
MSLFSDMGTFYRKVILPEGDSKEVMAERFGETITPNMRALRLSMTVADYLVAMGVAASDVTDICLSITNRYCERKVSIEIIATVLMFSQDRGNDREPLTLIRSIHSRPVNSALIQDIEDIVNDIHEGKLDLDSAETRLENLLKKPSRYPQWLLSAGSAAISAGIGALLSGSPLIIALSFIVGGFISYMLIFLTKLRMPAFFIQVIAAAIATLVAALVTWLGNHGVTQLQGLDPNLIIIGGIIMLVAGLAIVSAVEDAIDEFYITANARILRVVMLTAGIIFGIVAGLFIAKNLGVNMTINTDRALYDTVAWQYVGAIAIAAGYALSVNTRISGIILSGLIGAGGWAIYSLTAPAFTPIVGSFIAAAAVGASAALLARWLRTPATTMITAGIISLVPGLSIFNGLMVLIIGADKAGAAIDSGTLILLNALVLALAIAAGATFGNLVARPVRRTLIRAHNALPRRKLND